jgi:hypothetical protein
MLPPPPLPLQPMLKPVTKRKDQAPEEKIKKKDLKMRRNLREKMVRNPRVNLQPRVKRSQLKKLPPPLLLKMMLPPPPLQPMPPLPPPLQPMLKPTKRKDPAPEEKNLDLTTKTPKEKTPKEKTPKVRTPKEKTPRVRTPKVKMVRNPKVKNQPMERNQQKPPMPLPLLPQPPPLSPKMTMPPLTPMPRRKDPVPEEKKTVRSQPKKKVMIKKNPRVNLQPRVKRSQLKKKLPLLLLKMTMPPLTPMPRRKDPVPEEKKTVRSQPKKKVTIKKNPRVNLQLRVKRSQLKKKLPLLLLKMTMLPLRRRKDPAPEEKKTVKSHQKVKSQLRELKSQPKLSLNSEDAELTTEIPHNKHYIVTTVKSD